MVVVTAFSIGDVDFEASAPVGHVSMGLTLLGRIKLMGILFLSVWPLLLETSL